MKEYYQIAVRRDAGNLKFPGKCAYCLEPTPAHLIVKDKQLKGYELKVPYCEKHSRMIRYMKAIHQGAFYFAVILALLIAIYLHDRRVFVVGDIGFNVLVAGFIGLAICMAVIWLLRRVVLSLLFAGEGSLDQDGAVQIAGVYADAFVLLFHNPQFGTEFSQLNSSTLIERKK